MSNNNCLSSWYPAIESVDQYNSEKCPIDSANASCFKENDLFIKSQVSMTDTACDENSPISHKF